MNIIKTPPHQCSYLPNRLAATVLLIPSVPQKMLHYMIIYCNKVSDAAENIFIALVVKVVKLVYQGECEYNNSNIVVANGVPGKKIKI
ncbi:hypothetical protein BGP_0488 [Beggiatoa sp. PS]|nr:hypothetical protein BGP_0488 [Beggiatoa sp. PS]